MKKVLFILGYLDDADIEWITSTGRRMELSADAALITAGEAVSRMFVLLEGELSIRSGDARGAELARSYPGEILGEMSFLESRLPSESVITLTPIMAIALDRVALQRKLDADKPFAARFYRSLGVLLANRLRQSMAATTSRSHPDEDDDEDDEDELDPDLLERVSLAGARFDMLMRHFRKT